MHFTIEAYAGATDKMAFSGSEAQGDTLASAVCLTSSTLPAGQSMARVMDLYLYRNARNAKRIP